MAEAQIAERLMALEDFMKELAYQAMKTDMQVAGLSQEMRDFKDEMKAFKEEMRGFEERAEQERREMKRRWGERANKMGYPSRGHRRAQPPPRGPRAIRLPGSGFVSGAR
jgi:hypothetical protein